MSERKWFESVFQLKNFFVPDLELPRDFLLNDEIIFKQFDKKTVVFVLLTDEENKGHPMIAYQKIIPYLKMTSLFGITGPTISGGGGHSIKSRDDFGKDPKTISAFSVGVEYPDKKELQEDYEIFLNQTKSIFEKYYHIIEEFPFMRRALNYFYESEVNSVYDDDGFVKNMMSIEAIFNESAQDISYKLRIRVSFLIGLTKFSSTEVFQDMQDLYNLRNRIVHGSEIPNDTNALRSKLTKYSREAFKLMMILCENRLETFKTNEFNSDTKKKRILDEIDESMINPEKRRQLKEEIESKISSLRLPFEEKYKDSSWIVFRDKNAIRH